MKFLKLHSDPHNLVLVIGSSTLYEVSVVSFLVTYVQLIMVVFVAVFFVANIGLHVCHIHYTFDAKNLCTLCLANRQ